MRKGITKKQAEDELRDILDAVNQGVYMPLKKMPVFSEVANEWLEHKSPTICDPFDVFFVVLFETPGQIIGYAHISLACFPL